MVYYLCPVGIEKGNKNPSFEILLALSKLNATQSLAKELTELVHFVIYKNISQ